MVRLAPAFAALILISSVAQAEVLWRGDFETGDLSQWSKTQVVSADRLQVQSTLVKEGRYALRATVKQGDDPINASGNRNELVDTDYQPEGAERYYRWFTYFDPSYPSEEKWQVFTQWHQRSDSGSPPVEFDVYGEEIQLNADRKIVWTAPLVRGTWHEFIFHVKWSKNASVGFVELWHNGKLVLPKRFLRTDSDVYMKQGLYRNEQIGKVGVVYHDGMVMASKLEDVLPPPPVVSNPPPPPSPADPVPPDTTVPSTDPATVPPADPVASAPPIAPPPVPAVPVVDTSGESADAPSVVGTDLLPGQDTSVITPPGLPTAAGSMGCSAGGGLFPASAFAAGLAALVLLLVRPRPARVRAKR